MAESDSPCAPPTGDRRRVGATVYARVPDSGGGSGGALWVAEGRAATDAGAAWAELRLPSGAVAFARPGAPDATRWALPDIAGEERPAAPRALGATGAVSEERPARAVWAPPSARSPLLAAASWFGEVPRAGKAAGRRGLLERRMGAALGVDVRCAVSVHEGRDGPHPRVLVVARGSGGAYGFLLVNADAKVTVSDARPLLGDVHVPCDAKDTSAPVTLRIDGAPIVAAFADMGELCALRDALLVALAEMYGEGCDTRRIVHMRAHSVRFAAQLRPTVENAAALRDAFAALLNAADESKVAERDAADERLRQCLTIPDTRDAAAQCIIAALDTIPGDGALSYVSALLRAVHALIDCAVPYGDGRFAMRLQQCLTTLARRFISTNIVAQCARAAVMLDETDRALRSWRPARGSALSCLSVRSLATAREPGLYLAVLCHSGGRVLTDGNGQLPAARVVSAPPHGGSRLSPDAADMQWILRIAGTDAAWSGARLSAWDKLYSASEDDCLRAGILRAARELCDMQLFPHLGILLDTPVPLSATRATAIVCVCGVDAADDVPAASAGLIWRDTLDAEIAAYSLTRTTDASRKVDALPGTYRHCVRYVDAALRYSESVHARLAPGFYVGFFVVSVCSQGALALVPECNRNLPPLARAGSAPPTAEQWRWLQELNYRRRVYGSFGLPHFSQAAGGAALPHATPSDDAPFEARVAFAVLTLEAAVGLRVDQFYDLELVTLDEEGSITAFFAVAYCPPPFYDDKGNNDESINCNSTRNAMGLLANLEKSRTLEKEEEEEEEEEEHMHNIYTTGGGGCRRSRGVPTPPAGLVPMTYKLVRTIDHHHMHLYWPRVYGSLAAEMDLVERELCRTTHPFTSDEALRLRPANETMCRAVDLDRYALLVSCFRPLAIWIETDGLTLVPRHAPRLMDANRAVEEVVDIAVANRAAAADTRSAAMRALLLELSAATNAPAWPDVLFRMREMENGNDMEPCGNFMDPRGGCAVPLRSFDEVPVALAMRNFAGASRPPSLYALPCTLAEFIDATGADQTDAELCARAIVNEMVDIAAAGGEAAVIGRVAETMIACVETAERLTRGAALIARRADAEDAALVERRAFFRRLMNDTAVKEPITDFYDDLEVAAADKAALFRAGSPRAVCRAADGLRVCVARAACDADYVQHLLRVTNSALHALDLAQSVRAYATAATAVTATPRSDRASSPAVTLISREGRETPIMSLDLFRSSALRAPGRVSLPAYTHAELSLFAAHLNAAPRALSAQLRDFPVPPAMAARRRLFRLSLELQAPLLALRLMPAVFSDNSHVADNSRVADNLLFSDAQAEAAREAVAGGFLFARDVREWRRAAEIGGPAVAAGLDVLWWARYADEEANNNNNKNNTNNNNIDNDSDYGGAVAYSAFAGAWANVYAESRVRKGIAAGAAGVLAEEAALWAEALGARVHFVSLRGCARVGDAEIALLGETCPHVRSLDIAGTAVGDGAVRTICERLREIVECSVEGTRVSREAAWWLREHCSANAEREGTESHASTQF